MAMLRRRGLATSWCETDDELSTEEDITSVYRSPSDSLPFALCSLRSTIVLMPIYEYTCETCGHHFERLMRAHEEAACPECAGRSLNKHLSTFAVGANGAASKAEAAAPGSPGACGMCGDPRGPGACSMN